MHPNFKHIAQMHISSTSTDIHSTDEAIYRLLTNCKDLEHFLPEQVQDWEAGDNYCQFNVAGIATLTMELTDKVEYSKVEYHISNDKQIPVVCTFYITNNGNTNDLKVTIDAEVPLFLQAMLKNPFQKFADVIVEKIKKAVEQ